MVHRFAPATVVPATPMDHGCGSGGGSRVSDGERGAVVVAADMIPLGFVLRGGVPGCVGVVAGGGGARPRRCLGVVGAPSPSGSGARYLGSRWPRPSRLPQRRPVPGA